VLEDPAPADEPEEEEEEELGELVAVAPGVDGLALAAEADLVPTDAADVWVLADSPQPVPTADPASNRTASAKGRL
jgi:hypothetical protein